MIYIADVWHYVLLALGCGFVIFFHELGHFLAAKYSGVAVEQFAVGFGRPVFAWRRGIGFRAATTTPEAEQRAVAHLEEQQKDKLKVKEHLSFTPNQVSQALSEIGVGETEYRLNWMPLGGYVKMLGQDDMNPDALSEDPRAFNNKPVRKRMLIISAGVMMNIILAAFGFMIVYLLGFRVAPAEVGGVIADSPAAMAQRDDGTLRPLADGDHVLSYDGKSVADFSKLSMAVALGDEGRRIPILVRHHDGTEETLHVIPTRSGSDAQDLVSIGVFPPLELRGLDPKDVVEEDTADRDLYPADADAVKPGEVITAVNGSPVDTSPTADEYWKLNQAIADSDGAPVVITVKAADGTLRQAQITPHFQATFGDNDLSFAGMQPRAAVSAILPKSPARDQLHPGDVFAALADSNAHVISPNPSHNVLVETLNNAGNNDQSVVLTLENPANGATRQTKPIVPSLQVTPERHGLGVQLGYDERSTVVADIVPDSAAAKAGIKPGWVISRINGQPVTNWFVARRILANSTAGQSLDVVALTPDGKKTVQMSLSQSEIDSLKCLTYTSDLLGALQSHEELLQTSNPLIAAEWGVSDTRDQVVQFYLTIRRMFGGSVSYKQAMGPIGIFRAGAMFAGRGPVWLIWFLAMISAQLAVVNFLPIPIVDGGLFVFLVLEKIQGRPLSMNTQKIVQIVGLALILSVFLLVTYQDVLRWLGKA